jgi:predicted dehydrogenase
MTGVALIGAGRIAQVQARTLRNLSEPLRTGVFDPDQAGQFASRFRIPTCPSLDAIWAAPDADAVAVCSSLRPSLPKEHWARPERSTQPA